MSTIALIVAAGRGTRLRADAPKQYLPLAGFPILRHAVNAFVVHERVDSCRVVIHANDRARYDAAVNDLELMDPVLGGDSRQQSVANGLESLRARSPDHVLIHDAARPFIDAETISDALDALHDHAGVIPALPVTDSLKRVEGVMITGSPDRAGLWRAQTPQAFRYPEILEAHRIVGDLAATDDAGVAEHAGIDVAVIPGSDANFKITDHEDLARAERVFAQRLGDIRVGNGFDVHRFEAGNSVTLCGVDIPHDAQLRGHSDADVGLHALTDAILGAIGDGDIGQHFPPTDPQWRDAPSDQFLRHASDLVRKAGGQISHVDLTLILEHPRIGPYRDAMRARIAGILELSSGRVSIKATTTERLGFLGRGEGIAAQATATIRLPG